MILWGCEQKKKVVKAAKYWRIITVLNPLRPCPRIPETGQLINSRHSFLTVMEAEQSKIEALADSVSGESPLRAVFSPYPHLAEVVRELSWASSIRVFISRKKCFIHLHGWSGVCVGLSYALPVLFPPVPQLKALHMCPNSILGWPDSCSETMV